MQFDPNLESKARAAQDDSWQAGYIAAQQDKPARTPGKEIFWPSQWFVGYDASMEDMAKKAKV